MHIVTELIYLEVISVELLGAFFDAHLIFSSLELKESSFWNQPKMRGDSELFDTKWIEKESVKK